MKHFIEAYSTIDETARITGVALIPRISRNDNLYTKEELKRFDNVRVPLNWEHNPERKIGMVTFHYNPELETVYYEGEITDEQVAALVRNKTLFTSIEANPTDVKEICNGPNDCFAMPFGLVPAGLALTETPGVPETSVQVLESYIKKIKECEHDKELEDKYKKFIKKEGDGEPTDDCVSNKITKIDNDHPDWSQDRKVATAISMCSGKEKIDFIVDEFLKLRESLVCTDCGKLK